VASSLQRVNWTFRWQTSSLTDNLVTTLQMNALVDDLAILSSCQRIIPSAKCLVSELVVRETSSFQSEARKWVSRDICRRRQNHRKHTTSLDDAVLITLRKDKPSSKQRWRMWLDRSGRFECSDEFKQIARSIYIGRSYREKPIAWRSTPATCTYWPMTHVERSV